MPLLSVVVLAGLFGQLLSFWGEETYLMFSLLLSHNPGAHIELIRGQVSAPAKVTSLSSSLVWLIAMVRTLDTAPRIELREIYVNYYI